MPINKVGDSIKTIVKSKALLSGLKDINKNANSADINKKADTGGLKKRDNIWLILVVVIADRESTKVAAFISLSNIDISPIFVSVVGIVYIVDMIFMSNSCV